MTTSRFETDRMLLRRFAESDGGYLFELDGDPEVMRFLNGGAPTPRETIETEILPLFMSYNDSSGATGFWAAIEKMSGEFIGWFGLRPTTEASDVMDLGYRLRRAVWGKGYATEGAKALIREAFTHAGVRRITSTTYGENVASRRVMEKAGLKHVRTFRLDAKELAAADTFQSSSQDVWDGDDVEYALDVEEWHERCELCAGTCPLCGGPVGRPAGGAHWILCSSCHATFSHACCDDDRDQTERASAT